MIAKTALKISAQRAESTAKEIVANKIIKTSLKITLKELRAPLVTKASAPSLGSARH